MSQLSPSSRLQLVPTRSSRWLGFDFPYDDVMPPLLMKVGEVTANNASSVVTEGVACSSKARKEDDVLKEGGNN